MFTKYIQHRMRSHKCEYVGRSGVPCPHTTAHDDGRCSKHRGMQSMNPHKCEYVGRSGVTCPHTTAHDDGRCSKHRGRVSLRPCTECRTNFVFKAHGRCSVCNQRIKSRERARRLAREKQVPEAKQCEQKN